MTLETNVLICLWSPLHVIKEGNIRQTAGKRQMGHITATRREFVTPSNLTITCLWQNLLFSMKFKFTRERRKQNEILYYGTVRYTNWKNTGLGIGVCDLVAQRWGCSSRGTSVYSTIKWDGWPRSPRPGNLPFYETSGLDQFIWSQLSTSQWQRETADSRSEHVQFKNHKS